MPQIENQQHTTTREVNKDGGWLIIHHTQTWDERIRLVDIEAKEIEAQKAVEEAQAKLTELQSAKAEIEAKPTK